MKDETVGPLWLEVAVKDDLILSIVNFSNTRDSGS